MRSALLVLCLATAASAGGPRCPRGQAWTVERDAVTRAKTGEGCATQPDGGRTLKQGRWRTFFPNGRRESEATWVDGKKDGVATWYWPSGKKRSEYTYRADKMEGPGTEWSEAGKKTSEAVYHDDNLVKTP